MDPGYANTWTESESSAHGYFEDDTFTGPSMTNYIAVQDHNTYRTEYLPYLDNCRDHVDDQDFQYMYMNLGGAYTDPALLHSGSSRYSQSTASSVSHSRPSPQLPKHGEPEHLVSADTYHAADQLLKEIQKPLNMQEWTTDYASFSRQLEGFGGHSHVQQRELPVKLEVDDRPPILSPSLPSFLPPTGKPASLSFNKQQPMALPVLSPPTVNPGQPVKKTRKRKQRTEEEKAVRYAAFLERNRKAATKCRMRKKDRMEQLNEDYRQQRQKNIELQAMYDALMEQTKGLRAAVDVCHRDSDTKNSSSTDEKQKEDVEK